MATQTATAPKSTNKPSVRKSTEKIKEYNFAWEGKDRSGKNLKGEIRAGGANVVQATLRRQGIIVVKVTKKRMKSGGKVNDKDITLFTRQLATMMRSGVPLLQAFEIVAKGTDNPAVAKLFTRLSKTLKQVLHFRTLSESTRCTSTIYFATSWALVKPQVFLMIS
jgi:type II secretory pathway component PulF